MSPQRVSSADALPTRRQLRLAAQQQRADQVSEHAQPRPLTRRELRARERAAEPAPADDQPNSEVPVAEEGPVTVADVTAKPLVLARSMATAAASRRETATPPVNRAQRRAARRAGTSAARTPGGASYRWLPRLAVLGALGALTTVVPLSGAATQSTSTDLATGHPVAESSGYELLTTGGTPVYSAAPAALAADPLASLRSLVSASRSGAERVPSSCGSAPVQANGVLASEVEVVAPEIVQPMVEGTYQLTSRYGNRVHPIWGSYGQHTGLDMSAAAGTPIHAVADGTVTYAGVGRDGRSSMLVIIEHEVDGEKFWTWYVHMYPNGVYVQAGQEVSAGESIGAVGSYGNSTGPHLHLEVHVDEELTTVDPAVWLAENAVPLTAETLQCTQG
ncbi:M23 family metallopeptidase [Ruania suaedae]|uniref:M23 family metallopeptidase n=1 Tax=Ruania suaedae TaxID=2897774 RepID=UPI001E610F08|nr:M23 family metallopeptidase [Ruania suaedae]UFU02150.1 M23 family metallopeptidase [Ruania suaedae]